MIPISNISKLRNQLFTMPAYSFREQVNTLQMISAQIKFLNPKRCTDIQQATRFFRRTERLFHHPANEELKHYFKSYKVAFALNDFDFTRILRAKMKIAVQTNNFDMIAALLKSGYNPNFDRLLHRLCWKRAPLKLIELCLEKGADPNLRNAYGETAAFSFLKSCKSLVATETYSLGLFTLLNRYHADFSLKCRGENLLDFYYGNGLEIPSLLAFLLKQYRFSFSEEQHQKVNIQKLDTLSAHLPFNPILYHLLSSAKNPSGYAPLVTKKNFKLTDAEIESLTKDSENLLGLFKGAIEFPQADKQRLLSEPETQAWEVLYDHIRNGDTPLQIDSNPDFNFLALAAIRKLIHYSTGRAIILSLIRQKRPIFITGSSDSNGNFSKMDNPKFPLLITIDLNNFDPYPCIDADGQHVERHQKGYLRFGHELLHALHSLINPKLERVLSYTDAGPNYHTLSELLVITAGDAFPFCENSLRKESGILERRAH